MGCDIHAMIEAKYRYKYATDMWSWQGCGRIHISRNYTMFAALANVRNANANGEPRAEPISEPRLDYSKLTDVNRDHDDEYVSEDFYLWAKDYGQDGHSHSWVTLDELQTADPDLAARCRLIVLAHGLSTEDARLVFFFDN
jgi:hypothetical protein